MNSLMDEKKAELAHSGAADIYYSTKETNRRAKRPTTVNTRFTQAITNLTSGTSQFTIPASAGVSDVCLVMKIPKQTTATGLAQVRGWGYELINSISYRYAGAPQMFLSGAQNKLLALKNQPDAASRDAIYALGGQEAKEAEIVALGENNYAYVYLSIPGTVPSASNKPVPIDTSIYTQQIIITVTLNPLSSVFSNNGGTVPPSLAEGYFQASMVELTDQADSLARSIDMTTHYYEQPITFTQQETQQNLGSVTAGATSAYSLVGFRAGQVKNIDLWITKNSDVAATLNNPGRWYAPLDLEVSYAGQIYFKAQAASSQLLNLIEGKKLPEVSGSVIGAWTGSAYGASVPTAFKWVSVPFSQPVDMPSYESVTPSGLSVTNGILSVRLSPPTTAADYVLHASYDFAATLVSSQGTANFLFA